MGAFLIMGLLALSSASAMAQGTAVPVASAPQAATSPPATVAAPAGPGARGGREFTREEWVEAAKRRAEKRFDEMDTNHDGILTVEERRAAFRPKRKQP